MIIKERKYIILSILLITIICLFVFDHKKVKLVYVGDVIISPPIDYYTGYNYGGFYQCEGTELIDMLKNHLFPEANSSRYRRYYGKDYPVYKKYVISGLENINIENNKLYYICMGCKINKITYLYHSRFTNNYNDNSLYINEDIKIERLNDGQTITIYKGDVRTADDF